MIRRLLSGAVLGLMIDFWGVEGLWGWVALARRRLFIFWGEMRFHDRRIFLVLFRDGWVGEEISSCHWEGRCNSMTAQFSRFNP